LKEKKRQKSEDSFSFKKKGKREKRKKMIFFLLFPSSVLSYPNGAPHARLPTLGWSSWIGLGPGAAHPVFDYCDEFGIKAAADAFIEVGLYDAGYRHFHLDDCVSVVLGLL